MLASDTFVPRLDLKPSGHCASGPTAINNSDSEGRKDYFSLPWLWHKCRSAKVITVEPAIFLFMFSTLIYDPLCQQYYYLRYGLKILQNTSFPFPNGSFCLNSTEVDEIAGNGTYKTIETYSMHLVLFGQLANRLPAILVTVLTGPLADKFGRKPALTAVGVSKALQIAFTIAIVYFKLNPYYFILANFFSGVTGDFPAIVAGSFAYIADISSPKWRSLRFGIMQTMMLLGASVGQFLGGYWLNLINCDFMPPLWLSLAGSVALVIYTVVLLPESLSSEERKIISEKSPSGLSAVLQGLKMFFCKLPKYVRSRTVWKLWLSTTAILLLLINSLGFKYVNVYFLKALPFDFNPLFIGIYQATYSASAGFSTTVLVGILVALKTPDIAISLIGITFQFGALLLTGFAKKAYQVFTIVAFQGVDSITWIGLLGYRSKIVAPEDQGALFAIAAAVEAISSIIGTVLWPNIYSLSLKLNLSPGTTFFFMAGVALFNSPLILAIRRQGFKLLIFFNIRLLLVFGYRKSGGSNHTPSQYQKEDEKQSSSNSDRTFSEHTSEVDPLLRHSINSKRYYD